MTNDEIDEYIFLTKTSKPEDKARVDELFAKNKAEMDECKKANFKGGYERFKKIKDKG